MAFYFGKGAPVDAGGFDSFAKLLMHMDGSDASTTFVEENGLTVTRFGDAQIDTAQAVFGGASALFDGTGDYLTVPGANFALGTGDFVLDVRFRAISFPTWGVFMNFRTGQASGVWFGCSGTTPVLHQSGTNRIVGSALSTGTWYHIALVRSSGVDRIFVDGVQVGSDWADSTNYGAPTTLDFGCDSGGTNPLNGWLDEVRVSIGTDRGWFNGFTPPSGPYSGGWTPLALPNLVVWYDANVGVSGTSPITQWNDQSGNGRHLTTVNGTPVYNATGLNSRPTVDFDGGSYITTAADSIPTGGASVCSLFLVANYDSVGGAGRSFSLRAQGQTSDFDNIYSLCTVIGRTHPNMGHYQNGDYAGFTYSGGSRRIGSIVNGGAVTTYQDNVQANTGAPTSPVFGGPTNNLCTIRLGGGLELTPGMIDGRISELVFCFNALSTADRNALDAYFVSKWGF